MVRGQMKPTGWKKWIARGMAASSLVSVTVLVVGWLAFQRIPSWYEPPAVEASALPRIRASLPDAYQTFTDQLATGGTFEFELSARTVNEWIAARGELWPDARDALPEGIHEPVVGFVDDRVVLAARIERGRLQAIVSAHFVTTVDADELAIQLVRLATGSLPLPLDSTVDALDDRLDGVMADRDAWPDAMRRMSNATDRLDSVRTLREGLRFENRLYWSNGERYFRIVEIRACDGVLKLTVETL